MPEMGEIRAARFTPLDAEGNPTGPAVVAEADADGRLAVEYWCDQADGTYWHVSIGGPLPEWATQQNGADA